MAKEKDTDAPLTLAEAMRKSAEKKNLPLADWWEGIVKNIPQSRAATHVGKFTNPDVKVILRSAGNGETPGYVETGSVSSGEDILTPAQYIGSANFLLQNTAEGQTVLTSAGDADGETHRALAENHLEEESFLRAVAELKEKSEELPTETDGRLKQVYFPVEDGEYHLLTVLPSSCLLAELNGRVWQETRRRWDCHDPKNLCYGEDCMDFPNLTQVGFGGTKPQNISTLNAKQGGKFFLLPSLPPLLEKRELRVPKKNFFTETLYRPRFTGQIIALHKWMRQDRNNLEVRETIKERTAEIVDSVLAAAYALRKQGAGWTADTSLPAAQKIWLDDAYAAERKNADWTGEIGGAFARWLLYSYEKSAGKLPGKEKPVALGEGEFQFFKKQMQDILEKEVREG